MSDLINEDCDNSFKQFCRKLPKAELHAHLNGSFSMSTIEKLHEMKGKTYSRRSENLESKSLSEVFQVFDAIYDVTDNPSAIHTGTLDVIQDFYEDGVLYLELRSTPREVPGCMSQKSYIESVLSAINKAKHSSPGITVKLLLSINRGCSFAAAEETVKIAEAECSSSESPIIGIDLSGNPSKGEIKKFIPVLQYAKKANLKIALHMAEMSGADKEVEQLLKLEPDRIGHGTFLHPVKGGSESNFNLLQNLKIPIEMCLTSNVVSQTVKSYKDHHFPLWRQNGYPCVLCTDDKGVFNTTLSEEYYLAMKHFHLTTDDLWSLSYESIDYSFASTEEKTKMKELWAQNRC